MTKRHCDHCGETMSLEEHQSQLKILQEFFEAHPETQVQGSPLNFALICTEDLCAACRPMCRPWWEYKLQKTRERLESLHAHFRSHMKPFFMEPKMAKPPKPKPVKEARVN